MARKVLRPLQPGEALNLRTPEGTYWRLGARRKHIAAEIIEDSLGWLWLANCKTWTGGIIFEVLRHAVPADGWEAMDWYREHTDTGGCA